MGVRVPPGLPSRGMEDTIKIGIKMKNVAQFFDGVGKEFAKVIWPSGTELIGSTLVVLAIVFAFSCYLGLIDHMLARVMSIILSW